jgi:group I intron endonuclease
MNLFTISLKNFKKTCCIYKLVCTVTNKVYVGSTVDLSRRLGNHRSALRNNRHHSVLLQRAFEKYGEDFFEIEILELLENTIERCILFQREQHYLDELKAYDNRFGFNLEPEAGSSRGRVATEETKQKMSKSFTGRKHSDTTKERISKSHKGKLMNKEHLEKFKQGRINYYATHGHPLLGKSKSEETINKWRESRSNYKTTDETKAKMSIKQSGSNNPSAKLNEEKVTQIIALNKTNQHTIQEIADIFEVSKSTVENILYGRTWKKIPR